METRINIQETEPAAYNEMLGLETYLQTAKVPKKQLYLLKIRASQINSCAFCIDKHTKEALNIGETAQRIFLLNAWQETDMFTPEEKIILAMTEEITLISKNGLSNKTYNAAAALFDKVYIAQLILAIVAINGWNRIAKSTQLEVDLNLY